MKIVFKNYSPIYGGFDQAFIAGGRELFFLRGVRSLLSRILSKLGLVNLGMECFLEMEVSSAPPPDGEYALSISMFKVHEVIDDRAVYIYTSNDGVSEELAFCSEGLESIFRCIPEKIYVFILK